MLKEFLFKDRESLFKTLASNCEKHLQQALNDNATACLMVSGGSTPAPVYVRLSHTDLAWNNIHIALVDERWVDKDHAASNEALIMRSLLINNAENARFTPMKTSADSAQAGCEETEQRYQQLPKPFTVTLVGMGNDGHTASLFPHAQGLSTALLEDAARLTAAITAKQSAVTGPNTERISLTLTGLLQSQRLIVLLTGEEKRAVFRTAMSEGPVEDMPIRAILRQQKVPVELFWAP